MVPGAQLSVTDTRRSTRHPVDYRVMGEHRQRGDIPLHVVNISAHGFMAQNDPTSDAPQLGRGERVVVRLPHVGRIETHLIWSSGDRSGFQFERIIRAAEFMALIDMLPGLPTVLGTHIPETLR